MTPKEPKQAPFDTMFIVRNPVGAEQLTECQELRSRNRSSAADKLTHFTAKANPEKLAQKPTSGRASSPAGTPKPATVAAHSAGTVAANRKICLQLIAERTRNRAEIYANSPVSFFSIAQIILFRGFRLDGVYQLGRGSAMEALGSRRFGWVILGKESNCDTRQGFERACAKGLKIVAGNLTAAGWIVEIYTPAK